MSAQSSGGGGIGFTGLLTIVFIVLKLTDVIDWSWWWVLSPLWIGMILMVLVLAVMFVVFLLQGRKRQKRAHYWSQRRRMF